MAKTLRAAKDGCNYVVKVCGKIVYHVFEPMATLSKSELGSELDKDAFIRSLVSTDTDFQSVKDMLVDWQLYEHGWIVTVDESGCYRNKNLFYGLCQMGDYYSRIPKAFKFLK